VSTLTVNGGAAFEPPHPPSADDAALQVALNSIVCAVELLDAAAKRMQPLHPTIAEQMAVLATRWAGASLDWISELS
jgi:hypothetical protein